MNSVFRVIREQCGVAGLFWSSCEASDDLGILRRERRICRWQAGQYDHRQLHGAL